MAIELACVRTHPKPWGVADLRPWGTFAHAALPIGEISFERSAGSGNDPALLLKLLFTSEPLSIQVHPADAFAQSVGLPLGKAEAWYVLSAQPGAQVGVGLTHSVTPLQVRQAVNEGSIGDLIAWRTVAAGDVVSVPAGTIHAIGAGLVIAEVQQRSDVTYRLFDYDRNRELHVDQALAVADTTQTEVPLPPTPLGEGRTLLASNPHFVFERLELPPHGQWLLEASRETWLFVLDGAASIGPVNAVKGEAVFAEAERVELGVGAYGLTCLIAYTGAGGPLPQLLQRSFEPPAADNSAKPELKKRESFSDVPESTKSIGIM